MLWDMIDSAEVVISVDTHRKRTVLCSGVDVDNPLVLKLCDTTCTAERFDASKVIYVDTQLTSGAIKRHKNKLFVVKHPPYDVTDRLYEHPSVYVDMQESELFPHAVDQYLTKHDRIFHRFAYTVPVPEQVTEQDVIFILKCLLFFDLVILDGNVQCGVDKLSEVLDRMNLTLDEFLVKYELKLRGVRCF